MVIVSTFKLITDYFIILSKKAHNFHWIQLKIYNFVYFSIAKVKRWRENGIEMRVSLRILSKNPMKFRVSSNLLNYIFEWLTCNRTFNFLAEFETSNISCHSTFQIVNAQTHHISIEIHDVRSNCWKSNRSFVRLSITLNAQSMWNLTHLFLFRSRALLSFACLLRFFFTSSFRICWR